VHQVFDWADAQARGRRYIVYVEVEDAREIGLLQLAGGDPNRPDDPRRVPPADLGWLWFPNAWRARDRPCVLGQSRGIIKAVETVYVALRDEGVDVWRPVEAERISESVYRLANVSVLDAEEWEFSPGSTVRCELRELSDGQALVAVFAA
jgi:hypothetical protein